MAASPSFIGTPRLAVVNVASANTNRDGTGTITELIAGVAAGTRVLEITAKAAATTAAGIVNIFLTTDFASTWRLIGAIDIAAATASATVDTAEGSLLFDNLILVGTGHRLGVTTTVAQSVNVVAMGGDL